MRTALPFQRDRSQSMQSALSAVGYTPAGFHAVPSAGSSGAGARGLSLAGTPRDIRKMTAYNKRRYTGTGFH